MIPSLRTTARLTLAVGLGKSPVCTLRQVLHSSVVSQRIDHLTRSLLSSAEVVDTSAECSLWRTRLGEFWFPTNGAIEQLANCLAEQDIGVYSSSLTRSRRGDVVLDCGANVGTFSHKACGLGAAQVVAIEPASRNLDCLRRNLDRNIASRQVVLETRGLWDKEETLVLNMDKGNPLKHRVVADRGASLLTQICVTTIDNIVSELRLDRVNFIKMDVEGAELKALSGGRNTIRTHRPLLAIAVEHGKDLIANAKAVIQLVRDIHPAYEWDCPYCEELPGGLIFPEVLTFYDPVTLS
jgi:FkbM family methyltransferase